MHDGRGHVPMHPRVGRPPAGLARRRPGTPTGPRGALTGRPRTATAAGDADRSRTLVRVDGAESTLDTPGTAVLVPIKSFRTAKARLAPALEPAARAELARRMALTVIAAASPLPVAVVCDDPDVARWAIAQGASVVSEPGRGLNGAVAAGVDHLRRTGAERVIVCHADLPRATGLPALADRDGITLVPDRRDDGTNVICLPTACEFRFSYGPGSFRRHHAEAERLGVPVHVVRQPELAWDVDVPADLLGDVARRR